MVRANNEIAHGHFHKNWQRFVKMWFKQPSKKIHRKRMRDIKAKRVSPRPVELLRPVVHCPTVRYNTKVRFGKGFTLQEFKACKMNPRFAKSIGIALDYRRRNKSVESLQANVQRLKEYRNNLILFPLGKKKLEDVPQFKRALKVNLMKRSSVNLRAHIPTKEEINFKAYEHIRIERANLKLVGKRLKRKKAAENADFEMEAKLTRKGRRGKANDDD